MAKISQLLTINSQLFRIFARKSVRACSRSAELKQASLCSRSLAALPRKCGMAACKQKNWCYFHEYNYSNNKLISDKYEKENDVYDCSCGCNAGIM
jgi:hypothetical protein